MKHILFTLFIITTFNVSGQKGYIQGHVQSKEGIPLLALIKIKETHTATQSNFDGFYKLETNSGLQTLLISSSGYKNKEIVIDVNSGEIKKMDIVLKEDVLGLDKVVITATRGYLNRKKAPVIVTVTDAKVLEATQAVSLSEGLNFQPGLRVENNCQNCGTSEIKMNGLGGAYSQILIDSRPVFSALNSVYGLDQIPANIIKQIEVVRGGGSALYGSNAIAGTINIITKDPTENSFSVGGNLALIDGRAQDRILSYNGTIINKDFDTGIALFGIKRDRESLDIDGDSFTELTQIENTSFGLKAFTRPNDRKKITIEFNANTEFRRGGNELDKQPFLTDITEQIESTAVTGGLTYEYLTPNKKDNYSVYASTAVSKNKNFYGGLGGEPESTEAIIQSIRGFGKSNDLTIVGGGQYAHKFDRFLNNTGTFTGGVEFQYNDIEDRKDNIEDFTPILQTTKILGVYAQQEWVVNNKLRLLAGLRADAHNLADEKVILNPRANILYSINKNLRWRTSYARGFRAPQIYGEDVHSGLAGNEIGQILNAENLKSETSHSFLTSLDWTKELENGDFSLVTELFYTRLKDAFALEQEEETSEDVFIFRRQNSDGAKVYGLNVELKYAPNQEWLIQAGATLQESKFDSAIQWSEDLNVPPSRAFNETPNAYANFIVTYAPTKNFQNNISSVFTGPMKVQHLEGFIDQDRLETSNSFFELNWKSSYKFYLSKEKQSTYIQVYGGVQNIFNSYQNDFDQGVNRDVTYNYGPQRPRTYFLGLKFGG
ncbi:TonB-dependent receptor [Wenyingzhuangia sp. IMCC45533]